MRREGGEGPDGERERDWEGAAEPGVEIDGVGLRGGRKVGRRSNLSFGGDAGLCSVGFGLRRFGY